MTRWTGERIARMGFLVGLGWDAKWISRDPIIDTNTNNIHRQMERFGLAFRYAAREAALLPDHINEALDTAAEKRGVHRQKLVSLLLEQMDRTMIDNILDDEFSRGEDACC